MKSRGLLFVILTFAFCAAAEAQTTRLPPRPAAAPRPVINEKVFFSAGLLFQVNSNDFDDTATIRRNAENGRLDTAYAVGGGPAFDISGSYLVWKQLAVGVGLTLFSTSTTTTINAQVPHPFFFNQPRTVTGEFDGDRSETAVHIQAKWLIPVNPRMLVTIFGGPSFFSVKQDIVSDFEFSESYPYDTATFTRAIAASQSESAVGVNIGGDVAYFFTPNVGVGGTAQYSGATVEMTVPSGTADVKAGGLQVGGGLRLRF
ncbi:MAG TPA: outer membrane beta-barrel protein [Vicinamibacterales bacterium]|nr:outer membrane beta-barrel protein [Vicinamibacterales bacterium]